MKRNGRRLLILYVKEKEDLMKFIQDVDVFVMMNIEEILYKLLVVMEMYRNMIWLRINGNIGIWKGQEKERRRI